MARQHATHTQTVEPAPNKNFFEREEENPCVRCSAPCCRMVLIPHPPPATYLDLDHIRYMVGFQSVKMILNTDGQWQVMIEQPCQLLDQTTNLCRAHGTPRKPKICTFFNPYHCWYKRNFTTENPPDIIRIDLNALDAILLHVKFDEDGNITELPPWEFIHSLVHDIESQQRNKAWFPILEEDVKRREEIMAR